MSNVPSDSRLYHFRAWLLNGIGLEMECIEEEFRANTLGEASRKAWQRAAKGLADYAPCAIRMEYIEEGGLPQ